MKRSVVIVFSFSLLLSWMARAQAAPAAGGWISQPSVWNVAVGGSYLGSNTGGQRLNLYGWDASASEYPYSSHRWLGATIEASGQYSSESRKQVSDGNTYRISVNRALYSYVAGPSVTASGGRVRPFGHALFGAVNTQVRGRLNGSPLRMFDLSSHGWPTHPGMQIGGGVDFGVTPLVAIRAQADWVRVWAPNQTANFLHATTGVVFLF